MPSVPPETPNPSSPPARPAPPLDLPRQVMHRAGAVALVVLLLAVVLGLLRMGRDIDEEVDAAMTLAQVMARLGNLAQSDDRTALQALAALQAEHPLRHLALRVHAADGSPLLGPPPQPPEPAPLGWLLALHRELLTTPDSRQVAWAVARADAGHWTVALAASHDSERREAMANLVDMLVLLLGCVAGLLLVMRWNVRRAFAPLGRLLDAIARIEGRDTRAVQALPTMPIRELEAVAAALRHLGAALDSAEAQRRLLAQQVLTLQEDERSRLARELHDELGQHLTALRVDAAWLARRLADQPALKAVIDGMSAQCEQVQQDIRALLVRLQPFGPLGVDSGGEAVPGESLARLTALLQALVASWAPPDDGAERGVCDDHDDRGRGTRCRLELGWHADDGQPQPWPEAAAAEALRLPRPLLLTLYRISQEALTNVARHARAGEAVLRLQGRGAALPGQPVQIAWQVCDDGIGLPSAQGPTPRGNGIAGLQERVWAQGGELRWSPLQPGATRPGLRPGLRLEANFDARLLPAAAATATLRT